MSTAAFSPSDPALSRIGRFYLTQELGRGTVGCVYLGHDPVIGRDVAIKTFNPKLTPGERCRFEHQFINESRAAGRLAHPHIITIYDASSEGGATFIAMEYLQGRELDKLLSGGRRFEPQETASIAWKIADALDHAHQREVIHRDIKPANIFMVKDDQPKLIDFGIARSPNRVADKHARDGDPLTLMHDSRPLGTPNYMSPEQALGKSVDARTDIYSLGAVMYEMLTGRTPFKAENAEKLLQQVAYKAPPAPHDIDPKIPLALSQIAMRAMAKRPEKRYQDAAQMAIDLKRYLLKERRARRRMKIALPTATQSSRGRAPHVLRALRWPTIAGLAAAIALAGSHLLR